MKLDVKKLLLTSLFLMVVTNGCTHTPKLTPHFLDTQLSEMTEYQVVDAEKMTIKYKRPHQIIWGTNSYGNNFFCFPPDQAKRWREYILSEKAKSQDLVDHYMIMKDQEDANTNR